MQKIAFVTNIPTPYRKRQLELIDQLLHQQGGSLSVYFTDSTAQDRKWQVERRANYHFLHEILTVGRFGNLNRGLFDVVRSHDCVVIGGYEQPSYILLALLCRLLGKPYAIAFDGIAPSKTLAPTSRPLSAIKRWMLNGASAAFANGTVSKRYIEETLGISGLSIFNQHLSTNSEFIERSIAQRDSLRHKLYIENGLPANTRLILYSGRLIPRKHVKDLIHAVGAIDDVALIVAGHGELEDELRSECKRTGVRSVFLGHLDEAELAAIYVSADCLALPSTDEPWGLVVNEALFAQIPVVVSDDCGCASDLVDSGNNGFTYPARQVDALTGALRSALALDRNRVGVHASRIIDNWRLEKSACSFASMIAAIVKAVPAHQ